jgi:hypothetical protein
VRPCDMLWRSVLTSRLRWLPRSKVSPEEGKKGDGGRVVEIGGNRQFCVPSTVLLFKLVLEVVKGVADNMHRRGPAS